MLRTSRVSGPVIPAGCKSSIRSRIRGIGSCLFPRQSIRPTLKLIAFRADDISGGHGSSFPGRSGSAAQKL